MGVCNCSMFRFSLLYVHSSFAIILMENRELVALLSLSSWCLVIAVWLFLEVPWVCLLFLIVVHVFPDHTYLLFFLSSIEDSINPALDCNIKDVFVTADFNLDTMNMQTIKIILGFYQHLNFDQLIIEPTHFTENSSSIIDLIITSYKSSIMLSGFGDPFLDQNVPYHCLV